MKIKKIMYSMAGLITITLLFAGCNKKEKSANDIQDSGKSQVIADTIPESDCITKKEIDKNTVDGIIYGRRSINLYNDIYTCYPEDYTEHNEAGKKMNYLGRKSDEYCIVLDNNKLEDGSNSFETIDVPLETEFDNIKTRISTLYAKESVYLSDTCVLDIESTENVKLSGFNVNEFDALKFKGRINNVNKQIGGKMVSGGYYVYGYVTNCKGSTFSFYEIIFDMDNEDIIKAYVDGEIDAIADSFYSYKTNK